MNTFIKKYLKEISVSTIFILTYVPTLIWMYDRWFTADSYYSHGILIPFVTGFLVWQKKHELAEIKRTSSKWGIPLIAAGLVIHLLSSLFRVYFTSGFSMLIVLSGMILHFYSFALFRKILFPVCFLIFMIPIPEVAIVNISFKMKMLAAQMATVLLNKIGLLAIRKGSIIQMQHAHVIVDDVCSGLRSLISLTALGAIFAYWMEAPAFKRILLFASTIPIAIATNMIRVIFLAGVSEIWGAQYATGVVHDASGFMVFALAFLLLYAVGKVLE